MGQSTVYVRFASQTFLQPAVHPEKALRSVFPVALPPNFSQPRGTLLLPPSGTGTNDVQTLAFTGSPTGGTFTLTGFSPVTGVAFTTAPITYATGGTGDTNIQSALNAALGPGGGSVSVASLAVTFGGLAANMPVATLVPGTNSLTGGTSPGLTVAHTTTGVAPGTHTVYAGSGSPTCWLKRDTSTDVVGAVTMGLNGGIGDQQSGKFAYAEAFFAGAFYAAEIPNLDANAIAAMNARFIAGSLGAAGAIVDFP